MSCQNYPCGQRLSLSQLQNVLRSVGFPENEIVKASAIGMYESNGCTGIINDGCKTGTDEYSVGLYQINLYAHSGITAEDLKDPYTNCTYALQLWRARPNYHDWLNSLIKYQNDYQGIATQAQAIYDNGGSVNNTDTGDQTIITLGDNSGDNSTGLYILLGFAGLLLLTDL